MFIERYSVPSLLELWLPRGSRELLSRLFGIVKGLQEAKTYAATAEYTRTQVAPAFEAVGFHFLSLHPIIQAGVLKDAEELGVASAVQRFQDYKRLIGQRQAGGRSMEALLDLYAELLRSRS